MGNQEKPSKQTLPLNCNIAFIVIVLIVFPEKAKSIKFVFFTTFSHYSTICKQFLKFFNQTHHIFAVSAIYMHKCLTSKFYFQIMEMPNLIYFFVPRAT